MSVYANVFTVDVCINSQMIEKQNVLLVTIVCFIHTAVSK